MLFVLVTVVEIRSGMFETLLLDQIVLMRFPLFYLFTFLTIPAGYLCFLTYRLTTCSSRRVDNLLLLLLTVGLFLFCLDYFLVYQAMRDMLHPLGSPRPQSFRFYHQLTEWLNTFVLLFHLTAACLMNFLSAAGSVPHSRNEALLTAPEST